MQSIEQKKSMESKKGMDRGMRQNKGKQVLTGILYVLAGIAILTGIAAAVMAAIQWSGGYPRGYDTMYHLYRGESLFHSLQEGNWYPLYDTNLYNGVQALRYWPPLSCYLLAFLRWFTTDIVEAYLLYLGVLIVLGGMGWLIFGLRFRCRLMAAVFAGLWFFVPENLRVLFSSGNLPRGLVAALLPWLLYFLACYLEDSPEKKHHPRGSLLGLSLTMTLLVLSHSGEASILLLVLLLMLLLYAGTNHAWKKVIRGIGAMLTGYCLSGIWFYPSLKGGLISMNDTQSMIGSFSNGFLSLMPWYRFTNQDALYFGLSYFVICLAGTFLARRRLKPAFLTGLLIYFGTTLAAYPILSRLPGGSLLWMERFVSVVMGLILAAILLWRKLKKGILALLCGLLILDSIPSLGYIRVSPEERVNDPQAAIEMSASQKSLDLLKDATVQRTAVLDLSSYAAFVPYYLGMNSVQQTFGAAWQSAQTANNIVMLNEALTNGYYYYLFDRCIELGNDTVLIPIRLLMNQEDDIIFCTQAANRSGYALISKENNTLIYQLHSDGSFGTITDYKGIAIGSSSSYLSLMYPVFQETMNFCLTDYSIEELSAYEVIYLSGFTYDSKEHAEAMLKELAQKGCQIYVDMSSLPEQKGKIAGFFGISTQNVMIREQLPYLRFHDKNYYAAAFEEKNSNWNTVFLSGFGEAEGLCTIDGMDIAFYGTVHENVHLIGFNLVYYAASSKDVVIRELMDEIFGRSEEELPVRRLVPVTIQYGADHIVINTDYDEVNTTLAYQDIFTSSRPIADNHYLLTVSKGQTTIWLEYPYLKQGVILTGAGVLLLFLLLVTDREKDAVN